jgi:membrane complex biogenesis BtpA family protein
VENFGDEPYQIGEPPAEQLALMAAVTRHVVERVNIPVGVNVQFNAWQAEIAIAYSCEADFVRVEVFVDTVVSAQGLIQPCSALITRHREALGAKNVSIWADLQTKYTTNIIPQAIAQSAIDAYSAGADALIVTGGATGQAAPLDDVKQVREAVDLPVLVGSGTDIDNVAQVLETADGAIVGSSLKQGGRVKNRVSKEAVEAFLQAAGR